MQNLIAKVGLEAIHPTLGRVHILEADGWKRKVSYTIELTVEKDKLVSDEIFSNVEIQETWVNAFELRTFDLDRDL